MSKNITQGATVYGKKHSTAIIGKVVVDGVIINTQEFPDYDDGGHGYIVTPSTKPQILQTKDKVMRQDLEILAIPYEEVITENGTTVYIAPVVPNIVAEDP